MKTQILTGPEQGQALEVTISGRIDENFESSTIVKISCKNIILNLEGISFINSCGVRELVFLFNKLKTKTLILRKVPKIIVDQINMIEGLTGPNIKVENFYAPYLVPSTGKQNDILLTPSEIINGLAPIKVDPISEEELQFDDIDDIYFRFLTEETA